MTLFAHQRTGADWLASRPRAYLGDVPGLGKTRTLLAALGDYVPDQTLVVCPAIVRTHWHREALIVGDRSPRIYSYDEIADGGTSLMADLILNHGVSTLIIDEAHYLKNATAKRSRILLGKDGYSRRMQRVWLASGTPMPKNPVELFTQLCTLIPEELVRRGVGTLAQWTTRFAVVCGSMVRGHWVERPRAGLLQNADELKEILSLVMLRRTLDDVGIEVPELMWQTVRLDGNEPVDDLTEASSVRAAYYEGVLADIADEPHIARMRRRLGELKVAPVAKMLNEQLENSDEKVVVFAHHRSVLYGLRELLAGYDLAYVDGDTTPLLRDRAIDRFQNDPTCRVFLGQSIACQTGITLHASSRVVIVEPDWTADVNYQLGKRVARIGQKAAGCIAQMIALAGTLDEAIVGQNLRETRMAAEIFG